jgi:hypothetical protein
VKEIQTFCTLFDSNYLLKGVVMLRTLRQWRPAAEVEVLCMDERARRVLHALNLPGVTLLTLAEVEDEDLLRVKPGRSIAEYCWTLTASLCWYLMRNRPQIDQVTYVDADLMFFSDVQPLFDEMGDASITIIEHRFTPRLAHLEIYGRFNVEWVSFRRDEEGLQCLKTWRDQCIDWCFALVEDGKLGDQKYLDAWQTDYRSVCVLQHKGAGIAPWNYPNYRYEERDGRVFVDGAPLVFYHFHQFQLLEGGRYNHLSSVYTVDMAQPLSIYTPYERQLEAALGHVRKVEPGFDAGIRQASAVSMRRVLQKYMPLRLKNALRRVGIQAW